RWGSGPCRKGRRCSRAVGIARASVPGMAQSPDASLPLPAAPPANGRPPREPAPPSRPEVAEPVIRIVDDLIRQGLADGASDVHIEPHADRLLIRARVDGFLARARERPLALHAAVVSRIKITPTVSSSCCRPREAPPAK